MISSADGDADPHCLAAQFVDGPHLSAPSEAEARLAGWLADIEPAQAPAIRELAAQFPRANTILLGIAEASPYLFDLMRADAGRVIRLLGCDPAPHLAQLIDMPRKATETVSASFVGYIHVNEGAVQGDYGKAYHLIAK